MYLVRNILDDIYWIGGNDRRLSMFESAFPTPNGISYNSYFVDGEETVLFDTVDKALRGLFFDNITHLLNGRKLDYLIVTHMEPDHCALIPELVLRYPDVKIVCNTKSAQLMKQFFDFQIDKRAIIVCEGETLTLGSHKYTFAMAPMVHWPEVMIVYDSTSKVLYSADAFGTFGALGGNIFADEMNFEEDILNDARRYYANIVGKYGAQVQGLLKKASEFDVRIICPLHGPIWRENINLYINKYEKWSTYTPEKNGVLIAYASVYGGTENAAEILASNLSQLGINNISVYDVSTIHYSYILSDAFKYSHLVFASPTYNGGIFSSMETLLLELKSHNLQNRHIALIENGSWGIVSGRLMKDIISKMKNITLLENTVSIRSSVKEDQRMMLNTLAAEIYSSMNINEK